MKPEYQEWIQAHYPTRFDAFCRCQEASEKMQKAFPELIRVRGWAAGHEMKGPRQGTEHWWCKTAEGEVVDPTAAQFLWSQVYYREHQEGIDPEPIGKCMWCGGYCWPKDPDSGEPIPGVTNSSCSQECLDELTAEYG
jgi:hypothetical protein